MLTVNAAVAERQHAVIPTITCVSRDHHTKIRCHFDASVGFAMTQTKREVLSERFTEQWQRSRDWLIPFMQNNQPKFVTKEELRVAAMRELNVSKSAFNFGWIDAIETTGRHDWYEPLRKRLKITS